MPGNPVNWSPKGRAREWDILLHMTSQLSLVPLRVLYPDDPPPPGPAPTGELAAAAIRQSTRSRYLRAWRVWWAWCADKGISDGWDLHHERMVKAVDPRHLVAFLEEMATKPATFRRGRRTVTTDRPRRPATLQLYCTALRVAHHDAGLPSPTEHPMVRASLKGARNELGTQKRQRAAFTLEMLHAACRILPDNIHGQRDRALLVVGWVGGMRAQELCDMRVEHLRINSQGALVVEIPKHKTSNGDHQLLVKKLPMHREGLLCPVRQLRHWMKRAHIAEGYVFREMRGHQVLNGPTTTDAVSRLVKRMVAEMGLEPAKFGSHSLRTGFITECDAHDVDSGKTMKHTGHKRHEQLVDYRRDPEMLAKCAAQFLPGFA